MITHVLTCTCGEQFPTDGWLHALRVKATHCRFEGHVGVIELNTKEGPYWQQAEQ